MAQNDVIKEIVFIADEQHEAPTFTWVIALGYLLALVVAEIFSTFVSPLIGMIFFGLILVALLVQSSIGNQRSIHHFLVILSIIPLTRLLTMTVPPATWEPIYWYLLLGILLSVAVFITARIVGLNSSSIGLRITRKDLLVQLLIGLTGLWIGLVAYLILKPEPILGEFSWWRFLLAGLGMLIFAGLLQEIIFRGLLQTSALQILDRFGILYVALVFALLHLDFQSFWHVLFMLLVGLLFGVIALRTRSIVGISLAHGLASASLFLVFPVLMASASSKADPPLVVSVPEIITITQVPTQTMLPTQTPGNQPNETYTFVLIPETGKTATEASPTVQQTACGLHPNWVVYIVQPGDTLESVSEEYGIDPVDLISANCFSEDQLLAVGQGFFVPFDLLSSPTPSLQVLFAALNTPTVTPTKKPTRKPSIEPTDVPPQDKTPAKPIPSQTPKPPSPTPQLPTLAPTQVSP
jgi:membrane protease YdiL (CAAX protease family)/LysM repeat protein